jgi:hypothetical protein
MVVVTVVLVNGPRTICVLHPGVSELGLIGFLQPTKRVVNKTRDESGRALEELGTTFPN